MPQSIAVVVKGYPRLSETFIAQELVGLENAGLNLHVFSLRHPTDGATHPVHGELRAPVTYLPEYLHHEPARVWRAWRRARTLPGYADARAAFLADLRHDPTRNRVRRFGQALVLAAELPAAVTHLHAHFIHTPASVARYCAIITNLAWTCSAHAKDIWTSNERELTTKLADARWVVTCTRAGHSRLRALAPRPQDVHLSYHGLDLDRFSTPDADRAEAAGRDGTRAPVELVTVSRAVAKKGLDTLIEALARLPRQLAWRWTHIGGGGLSDSLRRQAERLAIADRIDWRGALTQQEVLRQLRASDIFVLPCRVARDGDRDGLPNVIVEAQSQRLPVVSTTVSGIPELIEDGRNGVLVAPDDVDALAAALAALIADPATRQAMGRLGEEKVRAQFDHRRSVSHLRDLFASVVSP